MLRLRTALLVEALLLSLGLTLAGPAPAQDASVPAASPPLRIIIEVPNDAAGRAYVNQTLAPTLQQQPPSAPRGPATAPEPAPATGAAAAATAMSGPTTMGGGMEMSSMAASHLTELRDKARALAAAAPDVPGQIGTAAHESLMLKSNGGTLWLIAAFALFVGGGLAAQRIAWWSAQGLLNKILEQPGETLEQRLRLHGMRAAIGVYVLVAFTLGSIGAFLLVPWPPILRETILLGLAYTVLLRLAVAFGRVLIAPQARHDYFRVLPLTRPLAVFWYRSLYWFVAVAGGVWVLGSFTKIIGLPQTSRAVVISVGLTVLAIYLLSRLWVRHHLADAPPPSRVGSVMFGLFVVIAWVLGSLHLPKLFWTLLLLGLVPLAMKLVRAGIRNVMGEEASHGSVAIAWAVVVERSLRVVLVIAGASMLAEIWSIDIGDIAMGESVVTRGVRATIRVVIIVLVAELIWRLVRALIDGRLDGPSTLAHDDSPEARRRQRLNTLLPILRNFVFALVLTAAVLMVLDALGIQIGPLLAGAGVIGIAVGFGAQTLVKDIISGIFYLLDDAFRVGEYIQTSSHKGTVESFSLRSVKLRHHRGPITTVPFGTLGAVQNLSRDWVIDKITIGVTYDTDLDKVKKIVKQIGKDLVADPEFGPHILEPLKMQGVEQMGDFAIHIRMKMMTKPGEQFTIRRRAYAMLKKAFEENGIHFAFPTVQISGGEATPAFAAAAHRALELTHVGQPTSGGGEGKPMRESA